MESELDPVSAAVEDFRVNTPLEIVLVKHFLKEGYIRGTSKTPLRDLKADLRQIGYRLEDHNKYEFFFGKKSKDYGHDFRHIYIKPLNEWFSYI